MATLTSGSVNSTQVTVRELGGEIWAELSSLPDGETNWQTKNAIVDLVMGVIARHIGAAIKNDRDLPVLPLPVRGAQDGESESA
jgi:hypothetical protein